MKDLVREIKKYFGIIFYFQKIHIMKMMAYPASFFISCIAATTSMVLSFIFVKVNFGYIDSLSGWSYYQALAVLGAYMIVEGIMWVFFAQLNSITNHISSGTMDGILLKPIDSQMLVSFWRGDLEDFSRIIIGFYLVILSVQNTLGFSFWRFILFLILLINGVIIFYSFSLFIKSISFWTIDSSGSWLLIERISANSQYPVDIYYHKIMRGMFTFIIPLAFLSTVPAKILVYRNLDVQFLLLSLLIALIFFIGSRMFWNFSLKHYSSASS